MADYLKAPIISSANPRPEDVIFGGVLVRTTVYDNSDRRPMIFAGSLPLNTQVTNNTQGIMNNHDNVVKIGIWRRDSERVRIYAVVKKTSGYSSNSSYGYFKGEWNYPIEQTPQDGTVLNQFMSAGNSDFAYIEIATAYTVKGNRDYIHKIPDLTIFETLNDLLAAMDDDDWTPPPPESTDPYNPGGTSQPGGGGGSFGGNTNPASTDVTNNIDIPPLPPAGTSAVNTGFITLFTPTTAELKNLADYMWSTSLFDLDTWQKLFANPMDALIGLSIVPVAVPSSGQSAVTVGNISTGVSMTKASSQYVSVNCGSIDFTEFWKGYLDYNPYTKVEIYLPYIGTRPISADDVMGKTVTVQYNIDVLSGACAAYIKCGDSVLYNFVGQCSCSIPISGGDMTQVINGTLSIAASIGAMAETGGMSAAAVGATLSTAANTIKTTVEKSGCISGMGGMLGIQTPYVIITRPRQALPENQNKFTGYPAFITATVGASAGYTEIEKVHLENIPATSAELAEIENLLKGGVIV